MVNSDFNFLKKFYGESFAKTCRTQFPTILEKTGKLSKIISELFEPSSTLNEDLKHFMNEFCEYVNMNADIDENYEQVKTDKSPEELLSEAGYILYPECKTDADLQAFKKYYAEDEELCSFKLQRLKSCRVWFAVKKNVDEIKRENFTHPERQDEYGTSVISIQVTRGSVGRISIKNRYNHAVDNPDATFSNNLENIIPGLTYAFSKKFGLNFIGKLGSSFELYHYVHSIDGKLHKYNVLNIDLNNPTSGKYFCENNVMIHNGIVTRFDKASKLLVENFLIDFKEKKVLDLSSETKTSFFTESIGKIEDIIVTKQGKNKVLTFKVDGGSDVIITVNAGNRIVGYENNNIKSVDDGFLSNCEELKFVSMKNVTNVANDFAAESFNLSNVEMPNIVKVGHRFCSNAYNVENINFPKLQEVGNDFMKRNFALNEIHLPSLKTCGDCFVEYNDNLRVADLPNLIVAGHNFISCDTDLQMINVPKLQIAGDNFLLRNKILTSFIAHNLRILGRNALGFNENINEVDFSSLVEVGSDFLRNNILLRKFIAPVLEKVGDNCLSENCTINQVYVPKLRVIGKNFLYSACRVHEIDVRNAEIINSGFMYYARLKKLVISKDTKIDVKKFCKSTNLAVEQIDKEKTFTL